jgi:hypothetical protein
MLETEIKRLREAIEANTEALRFISNHDATITEDSPSNIQADPENRKDPENPEPEATEKAKSETIDKQPEQITTQTVKDLAKAKMAEGVARSDIKKVITKLGAESIADLDQDGLCKLHAKLEEMTNG